MGEELFGVDAKSICVSSLVNLGGGPIFFECHRMVSLRSVNWFLRDSAILLLINSSLKKNIHVGLVVN